MRVTKRTREICRKFARGETPERVAEAVGLKLTTVERHYDIYLAMPMTEKLRITRLPEHLFNPVHRLLDDLKDFDMIAAILLSADDKTKVSLLDLKRKIKERMAGDRDSSPGASSAQPQGADPAIQAQLDECYRKVLEDDAL